jgi:alpha-amylase/alpha-mannosidase (GH57 family)
MDGENAWEHYPQNAWYFLTGLYQRLTGHPRLNLTTFSEHMKHQDTGEPIEHLVAGSWVYGTFSTWMNDREKNHAWDILGGAKRAYDEAFAQNEIDEARRARIDLQLAVCEGSDWFWWLGDYNPPDTVSDFERLFRLHLANLYALLHREPPEYLSQAMSHGHGAPAKGGTMRPGREEYVG